jgi:hypothetical protein
LKDRNRPKKRFLKGLRLRSSTFGAEFIARRKPKPLSPDPQPTLNGQNRVSGGKDARGIRLKQGEEGAYFVAFPIQGEA